MKKFLSFHGLGILLSAVVLVSLSIPGIWWKIFTISLVFIFQAVLESFSRYSYLAWNQDGSGFKNFTQDGDPARALWFSGVKLLLAASVFGAALSYGNHLTLISGIIALVVAVTSIVLYYGNDLFPEINEIGIKDEGIGKAKKIVTIFLISSSLLIAYLNFGTGYVWLSALLAVIFLVGMMVNDLVGEVQFENTKIKKTVIIISSLLPFAISIISTIYQYWGNISYYLGVVWGWLAKTIINVLAYEIEDTPVWVIILVLLMVIMFIVSIIRINDYQKNQAKAEVERTKAAQHALGVESLRKQNLDLIIYSLANDEVISAEYLIYLAKNAEYIEKFPKKKLINFEPLEEMFNISDVKRKIIWDHDLESVIALYDSWFSDSKTDDSVLELIMETINGLWDFLSPYNEYSGFNAFNKMLAKVAPNIPSQL
ncbi:MAG: hypothetical protein WCK59_00665 [Candidatus Falkowbacteria bacterium]